MPQKAALDLRQPHGPGTTALDTEPPVPFVSKSHTRGKPHQRRHPRCPLSPRRAPSPGLRPDSAAGPWAHSAALGACGSGAFSSEAAGGCGAQAHQTSVGSRLARSLWPGHPAHVVAPGANHVPTCRLGASFTPPLKNARQEADTARPGVATDGLSSPTGLSASRPAACQDRVPAPHARRVRVGTAQVPPLPPAGDGPPRPPPSSILQAPP